MFVFTEDTLISFSLFVSRQTLIPLIITYNWETTLIMLLLSNILSNKARYIV